MLEKLYTTRMSSDRKTLQNRFLRLRKKSGRLSRLAALVISVMLMTAFALSSAVMAAVGADGLEHWDRDEIYFRDGVSFAVNISGKNVPAWVYEDVAAADGNITVTVKNYEMRSTQGLVALFTMMELTGGSGRTTLACSTGGGFNNTRYSVFNDEMDSLMKSYPYCTKYRFIELTESRGFADYWSPFSQIMDGDSGKRKYVNVVLAADENKDFQNGYVEFFIADEGGHDIADASFDAVTIKPGTFSFIGDYKGYLTEARKANAANEYFTSFETTYKNIASDKVDISVGDINSSGIAVNVDTKIESAAKTVTYVYDENNYFVSRAMADSGSTRQYILRPGIALDISAHGAETEYGLGGIAAPDLTDKYLSGRTYKVQVVLSDAEGTVLYRWQEYVTIK